MKLTTRIERLEQRAGIGEPLKLKIAFFDSILDRRFLTKSSLAMPPRYEKFCR